MNENHIEKVANILGFKIEERFRVTCTEEDTRDSSQGIYYFTRNDFKGEDRLGSCGNMLINLLNGLYYKTEKLDKSE